ncbi:type IV toxin-antitoxin system AbiEi family antitoxin domain-containing protein [Microbacterium atlanticum]|uniref:type IV toxin-antitoxin system AbiEi family antitoxin domain-containing protein n=1 Tax=Microbacterium atlanticum TaxID=2782168 RepID=UPI0018879427|nr:type IV toxin-antitoxin system AbiEi family antitoxin domain-containing protein [Microbacterium atlanticum]
MKIADARSRVIRRSEVIAGGATERQLRTLVDRGELTRVRSGFYARASHLSGLHVEERHLLDVVAADAARRGGDVVFSSISAAVAHGLPLFGIRPDRVHVAGPRTDAVARPRAGLAHHAVQLSDGDKVVLDGLPCTSLARTVFDLARTVPRGTAVAAADAALRAVAWHAGDRVYDEYAAEAFRSGLLDRLAKAAGSRGVRQARFIVAFADGRAQLPGESISRLHLHDLGFAPPRLQVPFRGPRGEDWAVDFGLDDADAWGEFDGKGKYTDPAFLRGRTPEQAVLEEKYREDWIRGTSNRRFARWGIAHVGSAADLARRLAAFHISPPS